MTTTGTVDTTVKVRGETWRLLNALKSPGDSMDDVIQRLIAAYRESAKAPPE